jgi:acyl carrier protein
MVMARDEILDRLRATMIELFRDLDPDDIRLDARLVEDLDLDSIDAVDLTVKLQEMTGERVRDDELRRLRTVGDVVVLAEQQLARRARIGR